MLLTLAACSEKEKEPSKTDPAKTESPVQTTEAKTVDVSPAEVEAALAKALGDGYLCAADITEEELPLSAMGELDMAKIESYVGKQALVTALNLDTVVVVKCKDGYAEDAVKLLNASFNRTVSYVRQYPFGVAKVEGARLYRVGDVVMYILAGAAYDGENAEEEAKLAAEEYQKIDDVIKTLFGTLPENLASISNS